MPPPSRNADHGWFKQLFELSPDPTWIIEDNRFVECNEAAVRTLGYGSREEFLNVHPSKLSPPRQPDGEDSYVKAERMMALAKDQGLHRFEWTHAKADGTNFEAEVTLSAIALQERQVIYCVWRDLTERTRAEQALRESNNRLFAARAQLELLIQSSPLAIYTRDANGLLTSWNPAAEEMYGWTAAEVLGKPLPSVPAQARAESDSLRVRLLAGETFIKHRARRNRRDGSPIDIEAFLGPLRDAAGEINGIIAVVADISERKRAEDALKSSEEKFKKAFYVNPDAVNINRLEDGKYVSINPGFTQIMGYTADEVIAHSSLEIHIWDNPQDRARLVKGLTQDGVVQNLEAAFRAKDGSIRHGLMSASIIEIDGVAHILSITRDITERKRAEDAQRELQAQLHEIVEQAPYGIQVFAADGSLIHVNAAWLRLWSLPRSALDGYNLLRDEQLRAAGLMPLIERAFAGEAVALPEIVYDPRQRSLPGPPRWVNAFLYPLRDHRGSISEAVLITRDVTESRQAREELRIAATAFESQEGMAVTDAAGVILRVNRAFTEITGYGAEEIVGKRPNVLKSDRHDAAFYAAMRESIARTGSWQGEIWNRRKSGEVFPEWLSITAVWDEDGKVTNYVAAFSDITSRKAAADEIQNLAFYDPLTRLPNRRLLLDRLEQALASTTRSRKSGALLFIDLDNFKDLNDTLGHNIGDLLLQQVAQRLAACVRDDDTVARLGGDEFVVMLKDLSEVAQEAATHAEVVGEKILAELNRTYQLASHAHHCTASIGITLFEDHQGSVDEMLKRADLAMYQAKAAGRNTLRFFEQKMQAVIAARAALEAGLRDAVQNSQLLLHYQPQMHGEHLTGVEALVRWQHPQRGLIGPAEFIPLAEETGIILPLGKWVLETACAQLALWAARPEMALLTVAVNVSARQFYHGDFVDEVLSVLERSGANPQRLKLELTESLMLHNVEDVIAKMAALKAKGVGFSMDDFGTGHSSLFYLKRLPLDQLKIDQGFIRNILTDQNDSAIAKMVVALAESMGLEVIAEGVELEAQKTYLAGLGCHAYQGYLFSRPLPLKAFEELAQRV